MLNSRTGSLFRLALFQLCSAAPFTDYRSATVAERSPGSDPTPASPSVPNCKKSRSNMGSRNPANDSVYKSYGGYRNFMHSYGLKTWDADDVLQGEEIANEMREYDAEQASMESGMESNASESGGTSKSKGSAKTSSGSAAKSSGAAKSSSRRK